MCAVVPPVMSGCCVYSSATSDEGVVVVCAVVLPVMREWLLCVQ